MRSEIRTLGAGIAAAALVFTSTAIAADAGPSTTSSARPAASPKAAVDAGSAERDDADGTETNPHDNADPHGDDPHGGSKPHGGADGMFQPPEDGAVEDPSIPVGSLEIHIADPTGKPLPNVPVTLGILYNSVAKGESRKRVTVTTNEKGTARVDHLESGSTVAYRPMVISDGATFSVMPFRLPDKTGMRAILHVYPVVEEIESALVVGQSVIYAEVKDDRIQVQQAIKLYNFGKNAWVPKDLVVTLPESFTAFTSQQGMTDVGVDAVPKQGARIHGTFGPGQHMIEFRWQLPYSGEPEVRFDVGMPPHMAASRVIAPASKDMVLEVPGFPPPQSANDGQGQRALVTEKQLRREDQSLKSVTVVIKGLPTEGPGKLVATMLSAGGLVIGLVLGTKKPTRRDPKSERERLLADLEDLERARLAGDIGPKTYERARRELIDQLARTFSSDAPARVKKGRVPA